MRRILRFGGMLGSLRNNEVKCHRIRNKRSRYRYKLEKKREFRGLSLTYLLIGKGDCGDLIISVPNISVKGKMGPYTTYMDQVQMERKGSSSQENDFSNDVAGVVKYVDKWLLEKSNA